MSSFHALRRLPISSLTSSHRGFLHRNVALCRYGRTFTHSGITRLSSSKLSFAAINTEKKLHHVPGDAEPFYQGPLARTFRSLKVFSLSSLGLCISVSPFLYLIDAAMTTSARTGLIIFAVTTSSFSTSLVGWIGSPYVTWMRRLEEGSTVPNSTLPTQIHTGAVELSTRNVFLQERLTSVYDPVFLKSGTKRAFAKWELADEVVLDLSEMPTENGGRKGGMEEVAAETRDSKGNVKGRWIIQWKQADDGNPNVLLGTARQEGRVVRYFNVHEELLQRG
ncbi:hypothetical protein FRC02_000558 [Tulasnella sp. 418]|nr:hypothetical protein FRC02_000558 [Tulasnella sp. 418]